MSWSAADIHRVDASTARDRWDRLLDALVAYWSESLPDQVNDPEWRELHERRMRRRLEEHPTWLWIYERDGKTLALANFYVASGRAHIAEFWVEPAQRRKGLGRFLIDEVRRVLQAEDVTRLAITVPHNATDTIDFWRSCGFAELSVQLETSTRKPAVR